jgi:hypothetical protein
MNRQDFMLTTSAPQKRTTFTVRVMETISNQQIINSHKRLLGLTKPILISLILLLLFAIPAATYALTRWLTVRSEGTNHSGRTQYVVDVAENCLPKSTEAAHFEIRKDMPLQDPVEIQKILRAACELVATQRIVDKYYSGEATDRGTPKTGMSSPYIGAGASVLMSQTPQSVTFDNSAATYAGDRGPTTAYITHGEKLRYFSVTSGKEIDHIAKGDTVATISAVDASSFSQTNGPQRSTVVGLVRLSLPAEYYQSKQQFVMHLPACSGNPKELCPQGAAVDIYPRMSSESHTNPSFKGLPSDEMRQISGTIIAFNDNSVTLRSRTLQEIYTVNLDEPGFKQWNDIYASSYLPTDLRLMPGDELLVDYMAPQASHSRAISAHQVLQIMAPLDGTDGKATGSMPQKYNTGP